ncbi:MAG TPA: DUF2491 family protein [Acetobacteraceae bacterium]|nr:DUF2491 family protein [Acetobacteraceae bacterium]
MRISSFLPRFVLILCLCAQGMPAIGTIPALPLIALGVLGHGAPAHAEATKSGGYSRPGGSYGGARRPSTGSGGGYSRPGTSGFSGGDRSMSRSYSGQALQQYRKQLEAPPGARRPSTSGGDTFLPQPRRPPTQYAPPPAGGWGGAPYAGGQSRFGAWDAVMLWALLNSLNTPGHTQFFRDNRDNPDYQAWRREADRHAAQDPALAGQLAELDRRVTQPGEPAAEASRRPATGTGGGGVVILVIIIGGAVFLVLWYLRRRASGPHPPAAPPGLGGSARSRFRVGMTFPFDPSPFLLAMAATKVKPPPESGMISIEAIGLVTDGAVSLHRLYLPGRDAFLQLHLAESGEPDECRYFSRIDEVTPSSQDEWGFWLDPAQGMIGWPQFQAKDGKLYDRIWAPGEGRIAPREQAETVEDVQGTRTRKLLAMLYGAHTGAAPPAPDTEYLLVCAVDDAGQAWVEIFAGIDINPATLSLPSVALSA